jgi:integrase/recombinase XerC
MANVVQPIPIAQAIAQYLDSVSLSRSANTARTYRNAMRCFSEVLSAHKIDPDNCLTSDLPEDAVAWLAVSLKENAPTTERLVLTAATKFFEFLSAENLAQVNMPRLRLLISQRARRPGIRLPQFQRNAIDQILEHVKNITSSPVGNESEHLINLRDRAFLITLADTGLRVHEACKLRRGDLDPFEAKAIIIGKGNKQAVVRFSRRSMRAIKDYLSARQRLDGEMKKPLPTLPLFARHDPGAGKQIKPISTRTGEEIVARRVEEVLGKDAVGTITPHSFRHYFVTMVLRGTGNLKIAQELARHANIAVTQRYAHLANDELDNAYRDAIDQDTD